jgi:phosphorylcholine metabolism protein LicD
MYLQKWNKSEINDFKKGQKILVDIFRKFDLFCRKHNIYYWGVGGVLIGSIRNKKMIDFDGDIDISMTESDYNKFSKLFDDFKGNDRYWLQNKKTDTCYRSNIPKIRYLDAYYSDYKNKKWHNGIQIDIFVFKEEGELLVPIYPLLDIKTIKKNLVFPLKELDFEEFKMYVPNNYQKYCIDNWGDCPPKELPLSKQYPIEGKISFDIPKWIKEKYPQLYNCLEINTKNSSDLEKDINNLKEAQKNNMNLIMELINRIDNLENIIKNNIKK